MYIYIYITVDICLYIYTHTLIFKGLFRGFGLGRTGLGLRKWELPLLIYAGA